MDYGELLRGAWRVTWRHKYLWLLGLFATEGGCSMYSGSPTYNVDSGSSTIQGVDAADWFVQNWPLLLTLILGFLLLALVFWVISMIATGGLVAGADSAYQRRSDAGLGAAWSAGTKAFWRLLGMYLLVFAIVVVAMVVIGLVVAVPLVVWASQGSEASAGAVVVIVLAILGMLLLAIPIAVVAWIVMNWATRSLVLDDTGPLTSLRAGWRVFRANLGTSILVWLIALGISIGVGIALIVPLIFLMVPIGLMFWRIMTDGAGGAAWGFLVFAGIVVVAVMALFKAAYTTFGSAYWTIAYRKLVAGPGAAAAIPGPYSYGPGPGGWTTPGYPPQQPSQAPPPPPSGGQWPRTTQAAQPWQTPQTPSGPPSTMPTPQAPSASPPTSPPPQASPDRAAAEDRSSPET
jgi:hypothetical protein